MAMVVVGGPGYASVDSAGQRMAPHRNESSADSLVALLPSHVGLQGGLEDAVLSLQQVGGGQKRPFYATLEDGPELEGDLDDGGSPGACSPLEKKRRLTFDQVRALERNFEMENKLEPERKMQLAKELGLRPRQVAVWFQNRRARWKTKQLERDYETLAQDYKRLKADFDLVVTEKDSLRAQLQRLSGEPSSPPSQDLARVRSAPCVDVTLACDAKGENSSGSSNSSDVLDADSPRTTDCSSVSPTHDSPFLDASFPPECSFMAPPEEEDPSPAIKLEDPPSAVFPEDNSCNYLLLQLDDQSGVLPWWDWP